MAKDKGVVVTFRVDHHLADLLNQVPDKSSFIRDVILRSFYAACPLCRGRGVVPRELSLWADRQLRAGKTVECSCCLYGYPREALPKTARPPSRNAPFVCPHCRHHDHGH